MTAMSEYQSVHEILRVRRPSQPVYCIHPTTYEEIARHFLSRFPGRVLYAVKANDHAEVIRSLAAGGIAHFDCASLEEIRRVRAVCPTASCYFMTPVRIRGAAAAAQSEFGVRHFLIDHESGLHALRDEIDMASSIVFARMAVHHPSAMQNLSLRFGAPPEKVAGLLQAIRETGAEPALAFNVGSNVLDPEAYGEAIAAAGDVLRDLPFKVRLVDMGGGFPQDYPGFQVPPLEDFMVAIESASATLPLAQGGELLCEPGRALAAGGMSAIVEILLRKEQRLFLNDGMYGLFWELRFKGHKRFPVRCFRHGQLLEGAMAPFNLFGPTCDSTDTLPGAVELPANVGPGDYLDFARVGAYSLAGRTRFNGYFSDDVVRVAGNPHDVAFLSGEPGRRANQDSG